MRTIVRRFLESCLVIWFVVTAVFFLLRWGRVDPVYAIMGQSVLSPAQMDSIRHSLGLDRPIAQQYFDYLSDLAAGRLGRSVINGQDVAVAIGEALSATAPLAFLGWGAALLVGLGLGLAASHSEDPGWSGICGKSVSSLLTVGAALPVALLSLIALWGLVPLLAGLQETALREGTRLFGAVAVLGINVGFPIGRTAEAALRNLRKDPFFLAMRAQGYAPGWRQDLRILLAGIAPPLAFAGMEAAFLFGGTMVMEVVFSRAGMGRLIVDAMLKGDFPMVQAALGVVAFGYCLFGWIADGLAAFLDPRMRAP